MLMRAKAVTTITTKRRARRIGARGFGIPAIKEPTTISTEPARTAFSVPEMLKPAISSSFEMGVTR